jgi:hypothetical protein
MEWTSLLLAACLVGQAQSGGLQPTLAPPRLSDPRTDAPSADVALTGGQQIAPVNRDLKSPAPELLDSILTLPAGIKPSGRWITLVEALSSIPDRGRQLEVIQAYWRLSASVAELRFAWDDLWQLEQLGQIVDAHIRAGGAPHLSQDFKNRLAAAQARYQQAQGRLASAQRDLTDRMVVKVAAPLPSDHPHADAYRTFYDQIFGGRASNPRALLIDRLLPLGHEAITEHAMAVQAGYDAMKDTQDAWQANKTDLAALLASVDQLARERTAFVACIRRYNDEIAEYALVVAREGISTEGLVGMLIKTTRPATPARPMYEVNPASFNQPIPVTPTQAAPNEPTLAPPQGATFAAEPNAAAQPTAAPAPPADTGFGPQEVRRTAMQLGADAADAFARPKEEQIGLYPALISQTASKRAQELANLLHWDHALPDKLGTPATLADCLTWANEAERRGVIAAYWQARESVARYQVVMQEIEQLEVLRAAVMRHHGQAGMAEAMLRLRVAKLGAQAKSTEARAKLLADQFALTVATHRPLEGAWLLPTTSPHGGGYNLDVHGESDSLVLRRLAKTIPLLHFSLQTRAEAVVVDDRDRALATNQFDAGTGKVDIAVAWIQKQADDSQAFLGDVTLYNLEIADFALAVLPRDVAGKTLAGKLVLAPRTPTAKL